MNETRTAGDVAIKILTIIGFVATIALLIWLTVLGIKHIPKTFSSLASIAESVDSYRPAQELTITMENTVVKSDESFQIDWTDLKKTGEYHFNYTCTDGVHISVRGADGTLVPMDCKNTLTLPDTVHGLFISVHSEANRVTDVTLQVSFSHADSPETHKTSAKITIVNAAIAITGNTATTSEDTTKKSIDVSLPKQVGSTSTQYPSSEIQGYADLKVTSLGSGVLTNGVFTFVTTYDRTLRNALRFDVKNIGTKTSRPWTFKTVLPSGQIYNSVTQVALKPQEHIEYTIGFPLTNEQSPVAITTTLSISEDANPTNDTITVSVPVRN